MVMKSCIFWDITPCSPLEINRLHGVMSQKTERCIITDVRTWDPRRMIARRDSIHACMYVCMHVCIHTCMRECVCMHVCVFMYSWMRACMCMYACMHACIYECVCMHVCICMHAYAWMCMYACVRAYIGLIRIIISRFCFIFGKSLSQI
jgi:hypothetical protein